MTTIPAMFKFRDALVRNATDKDCPPGLQAFILLYSRADDHQREQLEGDVWRLRNNITKNGSRSQFGPVAAAEVIGSLYLLIGGS